MRRHPSAGKPDTTMPSILAQIPPPPSPRKTTQHSLSRDGREKHSMRAWRRRGQGHLKRRRARSKSTTQRRTRGQCKSSIDPYGKRSATRNWTSIIRPNSVSIGDRHMGIGIRVGPIGQEPVLTGDLEAIARRWQDEPPIMKCPVTRAPRHWSLGRAHL